MGTLRGTPFQKFHPSRPRVARAVLSGLAAIVFIAGCSTTSTSGNTNVDDSLLASAAIIEEATLTPEPELPPETADAGEPIDSNVGTTAAWGMFDVCSLYEGERLSELLGAFWRLGDGVESDGKCLWLSTDEMESSAVVSVEVAPAVEGDDPGTTVESEKGDGISLAFDGTELIVNVVSNDVDPTFAALNVEEAERRIADDLFLRLTGDERPSPT